jgi:sigma-B regulation protein RsbU (phosphoserine phosphatase)
MFRSILSRIPFRISLPLIVTMPVVVAVVVLSTIAFDAGRSAANDLMAQNMAQIHESIDKRLGELLDIPGRVQRITINLLRHGWLSLSDLRSWRLPLYEQVQAFDWVSSIAWGSSDGRAVWLARSRGKAGYAFAVKDEQTNGSLYEYRFDDDGQLLETVVRPGLYSPKERPWYRLAIQSTVPVWTDPYGWVEKDSSPASLALGYVQAFRDDSGQVTGVLNVTLTLQNISLFLQQLPVGRTGRAFVMNASGLLVATSTGVPVTDDRLRPISASRSSDRYIAAAARRLKQELGSADAVNVPLQLRLRIQDKPYLLMVSRSNPAASMSWSIATLVPESDFLADLRNGLRQSIKIGIAAVLITLIIGLILAAVSLLPMLDLVSHVRRVGKGDFTRQLQLGYATEFVQLSREINAMTAGLRDRVRLLHSLSLAMEVQQNLLPSEPPCVEGLDLAGYNSYCDETGGDYYDFLMPQDGSGRSVTVVVGDVVGHGIAAAMLMANARGILRSRFQQAGSPADMLSHLNSLLVEDTGGDGFMTLMLMAIDLERSEMRWATAGHERPILYDLDADRFIQLKGRGLALGLERGIRYQEFIFSGVRANQIFLAGTDGLWETFNRHGEMFGLAGLRRLVREHARLPAAEMCARISADLSSFRGSATPEDDFSFVILKIL